MKRGRYKMSSPAKRDLLQQIASGMIKEFKRSYRPHRFIYNPPGQSPKQLNRQYLQRTIHEFLHDRLVSYEEKANGKIEMALTERGRQKLLEFDIDRIELINPARWDKKWRLVMFDIPEKQKKARDALRLKLKGLGFVEMQHSIWIYPHNCLREIEFIVEFFAVRKYVRLAEVSKLTNEEPLLLKFKLD